MIEIRIQGEALDMEPGTVIALELISPLFQTEEGGHSHSFAFRLPASPANRRILHRADLVLKPVRTVAYDARVYLLGLPWADATLELRAAGEDAYEADLKLAEARIIARMEAQPLRALDLGGLRTLTTASGLAAADAVKTHANATAADPGSYDYLFPVIRDPSFYDGKRTLLSSPQAHTAYLNYWRNGSYSYEIEALLAGIAGQYTLVPQPRAAYVLRTALEELGYEVADSDWLSDPEIADLLVLSLVAMDRGEAVQIPVGNTWFESNLYAKEIRLAQHLPDITLREFVAGLSALFGLALIQEPDGRVQLISRRQVLEDTAVIDWTRKGLAGYTVDLEAEAGYEFASEPDPDDALSAEEETVTAGVEPASTVLTRAALPGSADLGALYYVQDENAWYRYSVIEGGGTLQYFWAWQGYRKERLVYLDGSTVISTEAGTAYTYAGDREGSTGAWLVPQVDQPGSSQMYRLGSNPFGLRFLFWRGLRAYEGGSTYPMAEPGSTHGDYSLYWHGEQGLYAVWWKDWADMTASAVPVEYPLDLSAADLRRIDWRKRVRVRVREGYAEGFVRSLKVVIGQDGIESATASILLR